MTKRNFTAKAKKYLSVRRLIALKKSTKILIIVLLAVLFGLGIYIYSESKGNETPYQETIPIESEFTERQIEASTIRYEDAKPLTDEEVNNYRQEYNQ